MDTSSQITLNFNHKIKLSNDGGALSSDTGELLFREFDKKIYQIIAGYSEDDAADQLTKGPVFAQIIGTPALASQPSLSRFYSRFDAKIIWF